MLLGVLSKICHTGIMICLKSTLGQSFLSDSIENKRLVTTRQAQGIVRSFIFYITALARLITIIIKDVKPLHSSRAHWQIVHLLVLNNNDVRRKL